MKNPTDSLMRVIKVKTDSNALVVFQKDIAVRRGDSAIALLTSRMHSARQTTQSHIDHFNSPISDSGKVVDCREIILEYNQSVADCDKRDSIRQATETVLKQGEVVLKESVKMLSDGLDTVQHYSNNQTQLINSQKETIARQQKKIKTNRKIAAVAMGVVAVETFIIYLLLKP